MYIYPPLLSWLLVSDALLPGLLLPAAGLEELSVLFLVSELTWDAPFVCLGLTGDFFGLFFGDFLGDDPSSTFQKRKLLGAIKIYIHRLETFNALRIIKTNYIFGDFEN